MDRYKRLGPVATLVSAMMAITSGVVGAYLHIENRYALASEHEQLEQRVSLNELRATYREALENLYFYRDQARKYPEDLDIKRKLDEAQTEVDTLKAQMQKLKSTAD